MDIKDHSYEVEKNELLGNYSEEALKFFEDIMKESEGYQSNDNVVCDFVIKEDGSNG